MIDLRVADTTGKPIIGAVVQLLAHTSTTPLFVDTVTARNGEIRMRVPPPKTDFKLYVVEICAPRYAPQFITAPFSKRDTLRATIALALAPDTSPVTGQACGAKPDDVVRVTVIDTSTFIGRAAASALAVSALAKTYVALLQGGTRQDSARATLYLRRNVRELGHRIVAARSVGSRSREAHKLLAFAFWTHSGLDTVTRLRVRRNLPANSKWWLSEPYLVGFWGTQLLFTSSLPGDDSELSKRPLIRELMVSYLEKMADAVHEPEIQSEARSQLVRLAYLASNTTRGQFILGQMLAEQPNYPLTKLLASRYAPNRPLREGASMPAFDFAALPDTLKRLRNTDIAGTFTLIDFWGTWCGPCLGAMPELHEIYKKYHRRGLQILSIAADERPEIVNQFRANKWPMPWLNGYAEYSEGIKDNAQLQRLGVVVFPRAVLTDPYGMIIATFGGTLEDLSTVLNRVLSH